MFKIIIVLSFAISSHSYAESENTPDNPESVYTPYSPYSAYSAYNPYSPYSAYSAYNPYSPYSAYSAYSPYSPSEEYMDFLKKYSIPRSIVNFYEGARDWFKSFDSPTKTESQKGSEATQR